jgi:hypothetical protein
VRKGDRLRRRTRRFLKGKTLKRENMIPIVVASTVNTMASATNQKSPCTGNLKINILVTKSATAATWDPDPMWVHPESILVDHE